MNIGIIIGRFQVPELTPAHKEFITRVAQQSDKVIVFVGQSETKSTRRYPLGFESVQKMLLDFNKSLFIDVVYDNESDDYWSKRLDKKIKEKISKEDVVCLFGGRDSFIPHYHGEFQTTTILDLGVESWSGTEAREAVKPPMTKEGREGAIWASYNRWPTMYQVVDAVILNQNGQILMCRKEGCLQWGLIGGFVDINDEDLEGAVKREVKEETGLDVNSEYQFSLKINDHRYTKEIDKVMSHVFLCTLADNCQIPKAEDDIVDVKWFDRLELPEVIPVHREMMKKMGMGLKSKEG